MIKKLLFFLLLFIPVYAYATAYSFNNGVQIGNAYINGSKYSSRNKYLILNNNQKYVMDNAGVMSYDSDFINGGFLNYREFCLSTGDNSCNKSSYLIGSNAYWTLSGSSTNRYYVNVTNGISQKSDSNPSSVRVTEFVKPVSTVMGNGSFTDPWYFYGNFYISLVTNSTKYAFFGTNKSNKKNKIEKYSSTSCIVGSEFCTNFDMTLTHGYENNKSDGCNLNLISKEAILEDGSRIHKYEISSIKNDVECVALFTKKEFTISFNCNSGSGNLLNKTVKYDENLVLPTQTCTRTGYIQDGWKNGNNEKWGIGSTIKFHYDDDQIGISNKKLELNAIWKANTYYVQYDGNGNTGGSTATSTHTYDTSKVLTTNGFVKKGYSFAGWSTTPNGVVKYNNGASVLNLTDTPNGTVTLYASWEICPNGTYNIGTLNTCTNCPSGYTSNQGASAENQCYMSVAAGKYLTAKAGSSTNCPAGQYRSGNVNINYGSSISCSNCAANTYSTGGAATCTACPSGYSVASGAGTAQNKCYMSVPAGKYLTAKASSATNCPAGQYRSGAVTKYYGESISCTNCAANTYSTGGASSCTGCPSGYGVASGAGTAQNKCYISVPAGKYLTANASSSTNCPAGQYRSGTATVYYGNSIGCSSCGANTYSTGGAGSCTGCPSGYGVAAGAGTSQGSCYMSVPAGKYLTANASSSTNCPAGQYRSGNVNINYGGSVGCSSCSYGTFSTGGAASCSSCGANMFSRSTTYNACTKCNTWILVNDKYPIPNQKWEFYRNCRRVDNGWVYTGAGADFPDNEPKPHWYYLENGYMKVGWLYWNNKWYWLIDYDQGDNDLVDGWMVYDTCRTINGKNYCFNSSGACTSGPGC